MVQVLLLHVITLKIIFTVVYHMIGVILFYPFQLVNGISFLYKKGSSNCENWSLER